ncbi:MAG: hypothetical protein AAFO91_08400, partial [Bacteroidota bacterium]
LPDPRLEVSRQHFLAWQVQHFELVLVSPEKDVPLVTKRGADEPDLQVSEVPDLSKRLVHQVQIVQDKVAVVIPCQQSARVIIENEGFDKILVLPKAELGACCSVFDADPGGVSAVRSDQVPPVFGDNELVF